MNKQMNIKNFIYNKIPSLYWIKSYNFQWSVGDLISGLTIALILIPQSLAYVKLADLPIEYGLYSSFIGLIVYCFFSTNKNISFGPTALVSLALGSALKDLLETPETELKDVLPTLCLFVSVGLTLLGLFKFGNLINLIPHPVNIGFTTAVALIISISQIPNLLGIKLENGGSEDNTFGSVYEIVINLKNARLIDLLLGLSSLGFLILLKLLCKKYPKKLKYVGILSNTICMILFTIIVMIINFDSSKDINMIKTIPKGIHIYVPKLDSWQTAIKMMKNAGSVILVVIIEHCSVSKHFGKKKVDNNQELMAVGISNFVALFFGGVTSGGSFCRSAVQEKSGSNSPITSVITGTIVLVTILFLTPMFYYVPYSTLSAVIIIAVFHLIVSPKVLKKLWKINKTDLVICLLSLILTISFGIEIGIISSTVISFANLLYKLSYPDFENVDPASYKKLDADEGRRVIILRPSQSIIYCNGDYLVNKFIKEINKNTRPHVNIESDDWKPNKEKLNIDNSNIPFLKAVILDFISVDTIDSSGIQSLIKLKSYLSYYQHDEDSILHFVNLKPRLEKILLNSDLISDIELYNNQDFLDDHIEEKSKHVSIIVESNVHDTIDQALSTITKTSKS